jgi:hypothetical protein
MDFIDLHQNSDDEDEMDMIIDNHGDTDEQEND